LSHLTTRYIPATCAGYCANHEINPPACDEIESEEEDDPDFLGSYVLHSVLEPPVVESEYFKGGNEGNAQNSRLADGDAQDAR